MGAQRGAGMRRDDRALVLEDDLGVQGGGGAIPCNIKRSEGSPFVIIKRGRGQSLVDEKEARAIPCQCKSNCSQWGLTLCAAYGLYTGAAALQPPRAASCVSRPAGILTSLSSLSSLTARLREESPSMLTSLGIHFRWCEQRCSRRTAHCSLRTR